MSATDQRTERQKQVDRRVKSRVIQGMTLLQETFGDEWVNKIDLNVLDLSSGSSCVLGQLYGEYFKGVESLWGDTAEGSEQAKRHGFLLDTDLAEELEDSGKLNPGYSYYHMLDVAWEKEIERLRAQMARRS